jgi:arsenite methyltransferase
MSNEQFDVHGAVRDYYRSALAAKGSDPANDAVASDDRAAGSCCGSASPAGVAVEIAAGYRSDEIANIPQESVLGLGCGNPLRFADIREGERVLDLGSGGGIDCFIASGKVGSRGSVIGVDMTPEMLDRARRSAARDDRYRNVEFRLGEIENLPAADESVDLVISNCVVNLSADKPRVFQEVFRVLVPGGRLSISDMAAVREMPEALRNDPTAYSSCVSGAAPVEQLEAFLAGAGFEGIEIVAAPPADGGSDSPVYAVSALIRARKPGR